MGIEYSTKNYEIIENIVEKKPFYLCSIDINEYLSTEELNRYLIYKNKEDENDILFYFGKIVLISDFTNINEKLLLSRSKKFSNIEDLLQYITENIKDPELINRVNLKNKINITPDLNYLNRLV